MLGYPIVRKPKIEEGSNDSDRYIGTLGKLTDAPANSAFPHYATLPAANKRDWLILVSDTLIGTTQLHAGDRITCTVDGTIVNTPAAWEWISSGAKKLQYATLANYLGEYRRDLNRSSPVMTESTVGKYIPFLDPQGTGIFLEKIKSTRAQLFLSDMFDLVVNGIRLDIRLKVHFAANIIGDRGSTIGVSYYYNDGTNKYAAYISGDAYDSDNKPASRTTYSSTTLTRTQTLLKKIEPLDNNPITYAIHAFASQNSGISLEIIFAELQVLAWK
jgi:hypothetical protein